MRKKRSILLDKGNFNLMMERMEMRHTFLESEELKKSHLITESVGGKGRIAQLLKGISETNMDAMFKRLKLKSDIVDNVKKGLNYLEDPIQNARSFDELSEEFFFEGIESIMRELDVEGAEIVKMKIKDIFELQRIVEMDGNPFINLLKDDKIGMDGIRKRLKNVMDDYPDFFTNKLGDEGKLLEGESITDFLYRQSLKDGLLNPEIPKFRLREIQSELMTRNVGENEVLGEIDVKPGDDIIGDAGGNIIKVPKSAKFKSFMAGLYKWSGTKFYVRSFTKRWLPTVSGTGPLKWTQGKLLTIVDVGLRLKTALIMPYPPAIAAFLLHCLGKTFLMDPPDIDVMQNAEEKKYEYRLEDCLGMDLMNEQASMEDGTSVNEMGFPMWNIWPIYWVGKTMGVPEYFSEGTSSTFNTQFTLAMREMDKSLDEFWDKQKDKSLPVIINTKCDDKLVDIVLNSFKENINGTIDKFTEGGVVVSAYNWLQNKIMGVKQPKLGKEDTEQMLKIFGKLEGIKEFQQNLYLELSPYIPEGAKKVEMKKNGPTLTEIVKYKCESKRVELIIEKINKLNRTITFGDGETKTLGKCKYGDWCDNLKFWEQLATKTGDGVWSPEQCKQNTEEIRTIYNYVTIVQLFKGMKIEDTLLDPKAWEYNCAALANAHKKDGENNTIRSWICAADANETLVENLGEVTGEVTIIAGKEYLNIPYKWLDIFNLNNYSNSNIANCNILKSAVESFDNKYMLDNSPGKERNYRIKEGDGVTQNDQGQRSYDVKNKNVQDMMSEVWCTTKNLKSDQYEGLTVENCSKQLKEFMNDLDC